MKRTPRNYEGTLPVYKNICDVAAFFLEKIKTKKKCDIKKIWIDIIGKKLAPMTKVVSFENKILFVKVKNSTLHSLLNNYEKEKIIQKIKEKFSEDIIKDIIFKIG